MKLPLAILLAGLAAQQPTFTSATSLVEVDIIARDRDGRFVSGLTSDDFEVFEEGKPQAIQHFYLDGKYRRIVLKAKWAGFDVRARRGYVASPLPAAKQLRITK